MKKRSHHGQIDQTKRSSSRGKRHSAIFELQIPESVAKAYDGVQSLVTRDGETSLEELQGAVEYLLDRVRAARNQND